jgi:ATP-dependent RNA helicase DDX49/DBP8
MVAAEDGQNGEQGFALFANSKRKRKNIKSSEPPEVAPKHAKHEQLQQEEPPPTTGAEEPAGPGPSSLSLQERAESFRALGLSEHLCTVCQTLGMQRPTQVQTGCIPAILAGKDVVGVAQTGSGKTAAFALPILQRLARDPYGVFALVLTPTRYKASTRGFASQCLIFTRVDQQGTSQDNIIC